MAIRAVMLWCAGLGGLGVDWDGMRGPWEETARTIGADVKARTWDGPRDLYNALIGYDFAAVGGHSHGGDWVYEQMPNQRVDVLGILDLAPPLDPDAWKRSDVTPWPKPLGATQTLCWFQRHDPFGLAGVRVGSDAIDTTPWWKNLPFGTFAHNAMVSDPRVTTALSAAILTAYAAKLHALVQSPPNP